MKHSCYLELRAKTAGDILSIFFSAALPRSLTVSKRRKVNTNFRFSVFDFLCHVFGVYVIEEE